MKDTDEIQIKGAFQLIGKLKRMHEKIAKDRNELRAIFEEYESVLDSTENALSDLEGVIDTLSQYA